MKYVKQAITRLEDCNANVKATSVYTREKCLFDPSKHLEDKDLREEVE